MLSITTRSKEEIANMSMIELAFEILEEKKSAINFYDIMKQIAELRGMSKDELENRIAQFYTDLNIDGRFLCLGDNMWGIKHWYPYDQIDDDISQSTPKKKKAKKADPDEDDFDLEDDFDDVEDVDDFDDADDTDPIVDEDLDVDDDDSFDDDEEDYDEDLIDDEEFDLEDEELDEEEEEEEEDFVDEDDDEEVK